MQIIVKSKMLFFSGILFVFLAVSPIIYRKIINLRSNDFNLLIISIDTLRPDHMSTYGYEKKTTPSIDKFASNSFIFDNAFTNIPQTYTSFASLMTGLDPVNSGIYRNKKRVAYNEGKISDNTDTLSRIFHQYNYYTAAIMTSPTLDPILTNMNSGFNEYNYYPYNVFEPNHNNYFNDVRSTNLWLTKNKEKKFFLWTHLMDPHTPYYPPEKYRCLFNKENCQSISKKTEVQLRDDQIKYEWCNTLVPKDVIKEQVTLYDGDIAMADSLVGEILNTLKETGLDSKTIVVIYGDHGEGFDHNYSFAHGRVLYHSATRIPLLIRHPLLNSGQKRINSLISSSDVFTTILSLMDLKSNRPVDGLDYTDEIFPHILPNLISQKRNYIYSMSMEMQKYAIFDGRYKYIYSLKQSCLNNLQQDELYDTVIDPAENNNIITQNPDVNKQLREKLFDYLAKFNLPMLDYTEYSKDDQIKTIENLKSLGY